MTDEQKDILIAKMLDAPSSLSDEELDLILGDKELREIYDVSSDVRGACVRHPEFDIEHEWKLFRHKIHPRRFHHRWFMKVAAIFLGVLVVGGGAGKIIDYFFSASQKDMIAKTELPAEPQKPAEPANILPEPKNETIEVSTSDKTDRRASVRRHQYVATVKSDKESLGDFCDLDIDELLRIEQARIDNDLAILTAQEIIEEYNLSLQDMNLNFADEDEITTAINSLTMQ